MTGFGIGVLGLVVWVLCWTVRWALTRPPRELTLDVSVKHPDSKV